MQPIPARHYRQLAALRVLIVDDESTMRRVTRSLLHAINVKDVYEASDGSRGLDAICRHAPDVVILDWSMPKISGPDFIRQVRAPDTFPFPDVPIIMLTGHGGRSRVMEAVRLGVNEFLLKPVSSRALLTRLLSTITNPRQMVKRGDYYGPEPRKLASYKPEDDPAFSQVVMIS